MHRHYGGARAAQAKSQELSMMSLESVSARCYIISIFDPLSIEGTKGSGLTFQQIALELMPGATDHHGMEPKDRRDVFHGVGVGM